MIALWMGHALVVSTLVAAGARCLDELLGLSGRPARGVWAGALLLAVVLPLAGVRRPSAPKAGPLEASRPAMVVEVPSATAGAPVGVEPLLTRRAPAAGPSAEGARFGILTRAAEIPGSVTLRRLDRPLLAGWSAISGLLLALLGWTVARARLERRRLPVTRTRGVRVRRSIATGPAVLGVLHPDIVLPGWLLDRGGAALELAVEHEREHVRAGDPLLLLSGAVMAALVPWNLAAWWILSRLRLAVEIDCDRRVVGGGASRGAYGALLLEIATAPRGGSSGGVTALTGDESHLEARVRALVRRGRGPGTVRTAVLGVGAGAVLLVACQSRFVIPVEPLPVEDFTAAGTVAGSSTGVDRAENGTVATAVAGGSAGDLSPRGPEISRGIAGSELPTGTPAETAGGPARPEGQDTPGSRESLVARLSADSVVVIGSGGERVVVRSMLEPPRQAGQGVDRSRSTSPLAEATGLRLNQGGLVERVPTPPADPTSLGGVERERGVATYRAVDVAAARAGPEASRQPITVARVGGVPASTGGGRVRSPMPHAQDPEDVLHHLRAITTRSGELPVDTPQAVPREFVVIENLRLEVPSDPAARPLLVVDGAVVGDDPRYPRIVVDGIEIPRSLSSVIPAGREIESIEVVRGSAAVEAYGSRARQGVIIIRTRAVEETVSSGADRPGQR